MNNDWILFSDKWPLKNEIVEIVWMYKYEVENDNLATTCKWVYVDWDSDMIPYKWRKAFL